jgi:DNA-binding protein YbaB
MMLNLVPKALKRFHFTGQPFSLHKLDDRDWVSAPERPKYDSEGGGRFSFSIPRVDDEESLRDPFFDFFVNSRRFVHASIIQNKRGIIRRMEDSLMMDQMKQLIEMQRKAQELQKQLEMIKVEKSNSSRSLSVTVNGAQRIEAIQIDPFWFSPDKKAPLESSLAQLINEAFDAAQRQSASQAAALMKDLKGLGIPGL